MEFAATSSATFVHYKPDVPGKIPMSTLGLLTVFYILTEEDRQKA